jgi:hypothetical protein
MNFKNLENISTRQIIEEMVLNQKQYVHDRDKKYKLGDLVATRILTPKPSQK